MLPGQGNAASKRQRAPRKRLRWNGVAPARLFEEVRGEERDVFRALTKRWQLDAHDAQRFDQIDAQIASRDPIVHPGRRAGDEPQVARIVGSLAAAENVHHLPLRGFVQLVHLVQIHGRTGDESR